MRKTNFMKVALAGAMAAVMVTGCGSSKVALEGTEVEQDICEKMQQEKPTTRAWGMGTHFKEMTARNIAEVQARAQFARAISSKIKSATSEETMGYEVYSGANGTSDGGSVTDQGAKTNDMISGIANEVVANTVIIKTSKRILPNKQYKVYVCLEYQKSMAEMATEVAKKVQQRIPDEQKMKMNFEFEKYRERVEKELEKSQQ